MIHWVFMSNLRKWRLIRKQIIINQLHLNRLKKMYKTMLTVLLILNQMSLNKVCNLISKLKLITYRMLTLFWVVMLCNLCTEEEILMTVMKTRHSVAYFRNHRQEDILKIRLNWMLCQTRILQIRCITKT